MIITLFISLYSTRLVLQALGVEGYGVFVLLISVVSMMMFFKTAMSSTSQRYLSYNLAKSNLKKQKEVFLISLALDFIVGFIVIFVLQISGFFFFKYFFDIPLDLIDSAKVIFHFLVLGAFFNSLSSSFNAVVVSHEDMLFLALKLIFESLCKLGIALLITYYFNDTLLKIYGILFSLISLLGLCISWVYCYKKYYETRISIKTCFNKSLFFEMSNFAKWNLLSSVSSSISNYGQSLILNIFFGAIINSAQGIASQVKGQLEALSNNFTLALSPVLIKSEGSGNRNKMYNYAFFGCKLSFFLLIIVQLPVIIDTEYILQIWLNEVPMDAVIFVKLILIISLIVNPFISLKTTIEAVGEIKKFEIVSSFFSITPLIFSILLYFNGFPSYTIYIIFIIFSIFNLLAIIFFSNKYGGLNISKFFKKVLFPIATMALSCLFICFLFSLFIEQSFFRIIIISIFNLVAALIIFYKIFLDYQQKLKFKLFVNNALNILNRKNFK